MTEYGSGGSFTVMMEGPYSGGSGTSSKLTTISAPVSEWKGGESPYSQTISVSGININSKVDIQMTAEQIALLSDQRITFTVENKKGTVTLFAIGDKPAVDCEFYATLTDVVSILNDDLEAISGNAISTHNPRTDYAQEDPAKPDFLKNKPDHIKMDYFTATLYTGNWAAKKQTINNNKILADSNKQAIISVAAPGYLAVYLDCAIQMHAQGEGTLTFICEDVPDSDVVVNILILTNGG